MAVVIVDIDGTIADCTERAQKYLQVEKKDWDGFYSHCSEDKPILPVCRLVESLSDYHAILFISGRRESCRKDTEEWIAKHLPLVNTFGYWMYLRPDGDFRHDTIVKPELLEKAIVEREIDRDKIMLFLEDRNSVVKKWRELGYTCLQVADGDF